MRDKLIELVNNVLRCLPWGEISSHTAEDIADHLTKNGVTIPVRCEGCKHMEVTPDCLRWCHVWNGINGMGDEGFCNYGERKDNE